MTVTRVVDGDTVEISPAVEGVSEVRLIGVDTPETKDPSEEVEPFGPEASEFATARLQGQQTRCAGFWSKPTASSTILGDQTRRWRRDPWTWTPSL